MGKSRPVEGLLGLGLDGSDGHVRVTKAENVCLVGGSAETHERMQDQSIRFNEKLKKRGKRIGDLEGRELRDLARECEMNLVLPAQKERPGREN